MSDIGKDIPHLQKALELLNEAVNLLPISARAIEAVFKIKEAESLIACIIFDLYKIVAKSEDL